MLTEIPRAGRLAGLALIAALALPAGPAGAHSFNVTLLVPLSGAAAAEGVQMRNGFMLATKERDAHAGQESDGHLGGLDVYVEVEDIVSKSGVGTSGAAGSRAANVVVAIQSAGMVKPSEELMRGRSGSLLVQGNIPFSSPDEIAKGDMAPAIKAFVVAFQAEYGYAPSQPAAQGYNAARRVDAAIREQGDAGDAQALAQHFGGTETRFDW
jgi:ABC-type branched-subunit amino acid transport system substrate-binding protein